MNNPSVIAFDVFGTVFDLSGIDRDEVRDYVRHIREPEWRPLTLPESWRNIPAHPDAAEGIQRLRTKHAVVTLSNGPVSLLVELSKRAGIDWDALVPIELAHVYKPRLDAYRVACDLMRVPPDRVLMVTANATFGDLEASAAVGMQSILIRGLDGPRTIIELAERLGC